MNPVAMPYPARRFLEWANLVLAGYCCGVGFGSWLASPLSAENSWSGLFLMSGFFSIPLVLVTSFQLLFVNPRRAVFGFVLVVVAFVALGRVDCVMH